MNKKISIVLATYNGERFIEEQLDSIRVQTVQPDELIVYDDLSKDQTVEIIRNYIERNNLAESWKVIINNRNKGYAKNFMDGAFAASGEYVFFCDQDDIWENNHVKDMVDCLEANPTIHLLCSNLEPFYYEEDTRKWSESYLSTQKNDNSIELVSLTAQNFHLRRSGCTMCMRSSFLNEIKPYWIEKWAHDDFVWKMSVVSNSCAILHFTSMKRRMHANNATVIRERTREKRLTQLLGYGENYESLKRYIKDENLKDDSQIVEKNTRSLKYRIQVVKNRNVLSWIRLFCGYKDCFPNRKAIFLDLYLAFLGKYKGV